MSDPTPTPQGESIRVGDVAVTLVNQGVINTKIVIVEQGGRQPAHHRHAAPLHPHAMTPSPSASPAQPVISFAPDGDRISTYVAKDGATATFREDRQNGGAVTFTLHDANGTIVTHGNGRGYDASAIGVDGKESTQHSEQNSIYGSILHRGVTDRVTCPETAVNITPNVNDIITREQIQRFEARHAELAELLKHEKLPVTMLGGSQITFSQVLGLPAALQACPAGQPQVAIARK